MYQRGTVFVRANGSNPQEEDDPLIRGNDKRKRRSDGSIVGVFLSLLWIVAFAMLVFLVWNFIARYNLGVRVEEEAAAADAERALRIANDTAINETLATEMDDREAGDQALSDRLDSVLDISLGKIKSINGVHSNVTTMDILLNVEGPGGLSIVNDDAARAITLTDDGVSDVTTAPNSGLTATKDGSNVVEIDSGAVLSVEGQEPHSTSKNIDMTGTGGITVTTMGAASNEVIVDGGVLETAVNNLNMENQQQSMRLDDQEDTDEDLQMQIDALRQAGEMIQAQLNGTTITFNMTLIELMSTVYMLKDQVAALQAELAEAEMDIVQVGTIIPYGGEMAPSGYLKCDGSVYPIANYSDLYSIIGDTYCVAPCAMGEFAVPDMRGRTAVGMDGGSANFGTTGQQSGSETVTLTVNQLASHGHTMASAGSHTHGGSTDNAGSHSHTTTSAGSHTHGGATGSTSINSHTHSGGTFTSGSTAQGGAEATSVVSNVIYDGNFLDTYVTCFEQSNRETCNLGGPSTSQSVLVVTVNEDAVGSANIQWNAGTGTTSGTGHTHSIGSSGSHTHTVNAAGVHNHVIGVDGAHTHPITSTGGDEAHPNVQPSLTVGLFAIKY